METGNRYLASIGQAVQATYGVSPLTHAMAVRNAIGVAVVVALAMIFLSPAAALVAGVGAITVAVADRPGLDVTKAPRILWTVVGAAVAVFAGSLLAGHTVTEIATVSLAAFCVGVLSAYGAGSLQSGVASILALLIAATQPQNLAGALGFAAVVLIAGVIQTVLSLSAAPAPARNPDGHALNRIFRELAAYVRMPDDRGEAPAAMAFTRAHAFQQAFAVYRSPGEREPLLQTLHRLQAEVMAFACATRVIVDAQPELYDCWAMARRSLAESLAGCGQLLTGTTSLPTVETSIARTRSELTAMAGEVSAPDSHQVGSWRKLTRTLLKHLDEAALQAESQRENRIGGMSPQALYGAMRDRARATIQLVRLNVRARSPMMRHAIRLVIAVLIASIVPVLLDLPQWYWSPLAVLIVLRPFYANPLQRMWESWLGLVIGLVTGTVVSLVFHDSSWVIIALVGLFIFLQRLYGSANVGFGITMIAASLVALLSLADVAADDALFDRSLNVAIGGAIAMGAHVIWPSWERLRMRDLIAECLDRYRDAFMMNAIGPVQSEFSAVMLRRTISRAARASAEESLRRPMSDTSDTEQQMLSDLLTQLRALVWSTLRLEAYAQMISREESDQELLLAFQEFQRSSARVLEDGSHAITHDREPGMYASSVEDAVSWMQGVVAQAEVEDRESPVLAWYGVTVQAEEYVHRLQRIERLLAVMSGSPRQG